MRFLRWLDTVNAISEFPLLDCLPSNGQEALNILALKYTSSHIGGSNIFHNLRPIMKSSQSEISKLTFPDAKAEPMDILQLMKWPRALKAFGYKSKTSSRESTIMRMVDLLQAQAATRKELYLTESSHAS